MIDIRLGDCLDLLPTLEAQSVDAVIADIPYGTTACKWDTVIPFEPMWAQLKRIAKPKAAIVLFGSQPFTSALVMSNKEMFKYCWIWEKEQGTNFAHAQNEPLKSHEELSVFSLGTIAHQTQSSNRMNYYPQGVTRIDRIKRRRLACETDSNFPHRPSHVDTLIQKYGGYPKSVIQFNREMGLHPTQKPVALMEYLIRTYTNEGDTVLDFTMGSGTTMVACVNTKRNGIGFEILPEYFEIAQRRIAEAQQQLILL